MRKCHIRIKPLLVTMQGTWGAWEADSSPPSSPHWSLAVLPAPETSAWILKAFADLVHLFFLLSVAKLAFVPISPRNSNSLPG